MPAPNAKLARKVLEQIEAHPERWDQEFWARQLSCGTSYCFAGHAVTLAKPDAEFDFPGEASNYNDAVYVEVPSDGRRLIMEVAQEALGLTDYSATVLFAPSNTLEHLRDYVTQLERPDFSGDLAPVNPAFGAEDDDEDYDGQDFDD